MDERDFEIIKVLKETKNITHAAEKLYTSQSALSKRINSIENQLKTKILIRSRHGIRFTPEGEIVYKYLLNASREIESMKKILDSMNDEICGTINGGFSINYALYKLPNLLYKYHEEYPKVNLKITTGQSQDIYNKLCKGSFDFAIIRGDYPWTGEKFLLSEENIYLVYKEEFENFSLSDYLNISHQTDSSHSTMISRWIQENNIKLGTNNINVDSITTCIEMVKRGLGWALLPEIALSDFNRVKKTVYFSNGEKFKRNTYLLCNSYSSELPQVQAFIKLLKENV